MMLEHIQLIHPEDGVKVFSVDMNGEEAAQIIQKMMAQFRSPHTDVCGHSVEAAQRAYWRIREELSKWKSSDVYRKLYEAAHTEGDHQSRARVEYAPYCAFADGLEKAADILHDLSHTLIKELDS